MFDEDGFDMLGADEKPSFDWPAFAKTAVPAVVSSVQEGLKKPEEKKPLQQYVADAGSWLSRPVLGPIPGGGVLAMVAGVLGLGGYFLFRKH